MFDNQIRGRKEYPAYGGGKEIVTVGEKAGAFVVFEIQHVSAMGKVTRFDEIEIRYVGDSNPDSALQVSVSVTKWKPMSERPHTTHNSFSLPADMVEQWIAPMLPNPVST